MSQELLRGNDGEGKKPSARERNLQQVQIVRDKVLGIPCLGSGEHEVVVGVAALGITPTQAHYRRPLVRLKATPQPATVSLDMPSTSSKISKYSARTSGLTTS